MTFHEWVNELFGTEVDLNDLSDDEYAELEEQYREEEE